LNYNWFFLFAITHIIGYSNLVGTCRQLVDIAILRTNRWRRFLERKSILKEHCTDSSLFPREERERERKRKRGKERKREASHQFQLHFLKSPLGFSAKLRPSASPTAIIGQCQYLVTGIYCRDGSRFLFTLLWPSRFLSLVPHVFSVLDYSPWYQNRHKRIYYLIHIIIIQLFNYIIYSYVTDSVRIQWFFYILLYENEWQLRSMYLKLFLDHFFCVTEIISFSVRIEKRRGDTVACKRDAYRPGRCP